MTAYYNEIDTYAAQWLRNLIDANLIAPGVVDTRSIEDVTPNDLKGFTQCHFFAGIGGWSHALRLAGWPDNKPVWTGSCPCQPFSTAGQGNGFDDARHLWPDFAWLIKERQPLYVFGEQVANGGANLWLDLVQSNLETMGYAFGVVPFTSASIGAPHIRERAYWVAESLSEQCEELLSGLDKSAREKTSRSPAESSGFCGAGLVANADMQYQSTAGNQARITESVQSGEVNGVGYSHSNKQRPSAITRASDEYVSRGREQGTAKASGFCGDSNPLEVNGFWRDADWLLCRDEKWRPVEPGTFPLVNGFPKGVGHGKSSPRALAARNRVGRLRGYGNAINVYAAAAFIEAFMGRAR